MFLGHFCQANPKILLHSDPPSCLHMNNLTVLYTGHCDKPRATCHVQGDAVAVFCNVEKQNYASTFITTVVRTCENNKYLALFIWILRGQSQNFWSGRRMLNVIVTASDNSTHVLVVQASLTRALALLTEPTGPPHLFRSQQYFLGRRSAV